MDVKGISAHPAALWLCSCGKGHDPWEKVLLYLTFCHLFMLTFIYDNAPRLVAAVLAIHLGATKLYNKESSGRGLLTVMHGIYDKAVRTMNAIRCHEHKGLLAIAEICLTRVTMPFHTIR